jgi:hypothetical protein
MSMRKRMPKRITKLYSAYELIKPDLINSKFCSGESEVFIVFCVLNSSILTQQS